MPFVVRALLLVEDAKFNTRALIEASRVKVQEILSATSLAQAINVLARAPVAIVILDLDLADSHSMDTLAAIRTLTDAAVVVLSKDDDELLGIQALKSGADEFVVRSEINEKTLRKAILNAMTRRDVRTYMSRIDSKVEKLSQMEVAGE